MCLQERPQINTQLPPRTRSDSQDDAPQSVIHVPSGFKDFREGHSSGTPSETDQPPLALRSPTTPEAAQSPDNKVSILLPVYRRLTFADTISSDLPAFHQ
jgi:hypothetical protein